MKLLIFHPIVAPYRIDFFNALAAHYDTEIYLYWRNLKDQTFNYADIESQFTFKPKYLIRNELGTCRWLKRLWRVLSSQKPNVVVVNEFGLVTILTLLHRIVTKAKYKIVSMTDDSYNMLADNNHFTGRHKKAINILAPRIDNFINVEPLSTKWYHEHFGKGIYFPIIVDDQKALRRYKRVLPVSEEYVRTYSLVGKKILLFVGRLVQLKNIQLVIRAFSKIADPNIRFIVVGSGELEKELKRIASPDGRIIFVGRKEGDELYAWYNVANIFVLASYQESFGAVTNEALLGGCRCLISKNAGSRCLINEGDNGQIFDPYDVEDLKNKMEQELANANTLNLPLKSRESLMRVHFKDLMKNLIEHL